MSNIIRAAITIRGVRPLLQHRFTEASLPLEKQERTGVAGNDPEEWKKSAMVTETGQLFVDGSYIFSCLRNAAKYTKKGKGSIQTDVAATLQVLDDQILLDRFMPGYPVFANKEGGLQIPRIGLYEAGDLEAKFDITKAEDPSRDTSAPVYLDVRSVRNPSTKGRNVRYRLAASPGWECTFKILWDKTLVNRAQMESVLNDAGVLVGLGDARAIGFGRFQTVSFEIEE